MQGYVCSFPGSRVVKYSEITSVYSKLSSISI
jgi:hypothetical protein